MTHTNTEQERAEFEAWAAKNYHDINLEHEGRSYRYFLANEWWTAWQAARRAQVVPQGWREALQSVCSDMVSIGNGQHVISDAARAKVEALQAEIFSAPQPPEAPVT